jgi:maltoporin
MKTKMPLIIKKKPLAVAVALLATLGATASHAVDFHGYVRSGIMESNNGGQNAYLASKLGRFGNETGGWWSMAFSQDLLKTDDGKSFGVWAQLEGDTPLTGDDDWSYGDVYGPNGHLGMSAYYITAKGYIAAAPEATVWIGKRAFETHEIQQLDWKAVKSSGNGAGIEGIEAGPGKLAFSIKRADTNSSTWYTTSTTTDSGGDTTTSSTANTTKYNVDYFDIRYAKLPFIGDSTVELIGQYAMVDKNNEQEALEAAGSIAKAENSFIPTMIITKPIGKGYNETYFQYTTKRFANNLVALGYNDTFTTGFDNDYSNAKAFRFINTGETYLTDDVVMQHSVVYSNGSDITPTLDKSKSFNIVARPAYIWNANNKTALEMGWFKQTNTVSGEDKVEQGKKVTLAQVITAGPGIFARPELRFYTTYMKTDKNEISGFTFNNGKDNQLSFGAQVEAWW